VKFRYKYPKESRSLEIVHVIQGDAKAPSTNFVFASSVVEFGLLLRESKFMGSANFAQVMDRAQSALGEDPGNYRADFLVLVEMAANAGDVLAEFSERE